MRLSPIIGAIALTALLAGGCTGGGKEPEVSTAADGTVTATITLKSDDTWVVTLPEGASEAYDLYGNDGRDPIGIWQEGPIEMPQGALFAIGLPAPARSDAIWQATGGTADGTVVELVQQGVNPYDANLPDAELGVHYFVYRGTAEGTGTIEFGRFPPDADAPEETKAFDVTITSAE